MQFAIHSSYAVSYHFGVCVEHVMNSSFPSYSGLKQPQLSLISFGAFSLPLITQVIVGFFDENWLIQTPKPK